MRPHEFANELVKSKFISFLFMTAVRVDEVKKYTVTSSRDFFFRVEAKRKGVARVEAFLDMMSFKGYDNSNDDRNDASSMSTATSKAMHNEEAKNSSTATSSSQSPSPPTFSSSSPEESMNRFQNKIFNSSKEEQIVELE